MSVPQYSGTRFFTANRNPTSTDDETSEPVHVWAGSMWYNDATEKLFFAKSTLKGNSVWAEVQLI